MGASVRMGLIVGRASIMSNGDNQYDADSDSQGIMGRTSETESRGWMIYCRAFFVSEPWFYRVFFVSISNVNGQITGLY